jgi:GT2 family glycosyltransferase
LPFDIVLVLYNSAAWLPVCLQSLAAVNYPHSELHLILVDNASTDDLQSLLAMQTELLVGFSSVQLKKNTKNRGFGAACNQGAALGCCANIFFLNVDTEVAPNTFSALEQTITAAPADVAAFECRQLPYETGHHIDPVSLHTTWSSAAALVVRRSAFAAVGGFDEHLFMYCEDVDLSWHLRAKGYKLQYVPGAEVWHYSSLTNPSLRSQTQQNRTVSLGEYAYGLYGNLLLRYKYGSFKDIWRGYGVYLSALRRPVHYPGVRRLLVQNFAKHFIQLWPFLCWRLSHRKEYKAHVARFEGGFSPDRGTFALKKPTGTALTSVVVRTCGRPEVLRQTLRALRHQTYLHFEVVVVEDGPAEGRAVVEEELLGMRFQYSATGQNVGRSRAGNIGLSLAKGVYLNFLDDDDFFYPDHLEMLVGQMQQDPAADFVTAASMAMEIRVQSRAPYVFDTVAVYPMRYDRMDNFLLCQSCRMPIQSVLFKREMFEQYGGLNEALDGDEDWSMWLKYFSVGHRINEDRVDIPRATSLFLVPADANAAKTREKYYRQYEDAMLDDENIKFTVTPRQMRTYYQGLLGDLRHLKNFGKLEKFIDEQTERYLDNK